MSVFSSSAVRAGGNGEHVELLFPSVMLAGRGSETCALGLGLQRTPACSSFDGNYGGGGGGGRGGGRGEVPNVTHSGHS